ncbi:hypothetical protein PHYPSEUDO_012877 [Phytophthora pseudosyringae]|uniref:Uncharacterized protein n=1 Tax=Phytophthora pseudosyringae TaxID=221518 RepID=A0A8T1V6P7_9STRA|nr:hypothetical protein PHYPSEUDO_012877 [Phytophthora pseudosyringae]
MGDEGQGEQPRCDVRQRGGPDRDSNHNEDHNGGDGARDHQAETATETTTAGTEPDTAAAGTATETAGTEPETVVVRTATETMKIMTLVPEPETTTAGLETSEETRTEE